MHACLDVQATWDRVFSSLPTGLGVGTIVHVLPSQTSANVFWMTGGLMEGKAAYPTAVQALSVSLA